MTLNFAVTVIVLVKDLLRYNGAKIARISGISKNGIIYMQKLVEQIFYSTCVCPRK